MTLNRGIYSTSFGFTDSELAIVESYLGTDAVADIVRDLWGEAYVEHLAGLMRQLEQDALSGIGVASGVPNWVGFGQALATTGVYGGASFGGATNPGLIAAIDSSTTSITRASVRAMFAAIKQTSGWNPDFIECSPLTATYLNGIGDNQIRYFNVSDREIFNTSAQVPMRGLDTVTQLLGVPLVENSAWGTNSGNSPADGYDGYVVFGARDKTLIDILTYSKAQDAFLSDIREGISKADNQDAEPVGLPVRCWAQAKTAASKIVTMDIECGFAVLAPNRFGMMTKISGFTPD